MSTLKTVESRIAYLNNAAAEAVRDNATCETCGRLAEWVACYYGDRRAVSMPFCTKHINDGDTLEDPDTLYVRL